MIDKNGYKKSYKHSDKSNTCKCKKVKDMILC